MNKLLYRNAGSFIRPHSLCIFWQRDEEPVVHWESLVGYILQNKVNLNCVLCLGLRSQDLCLVGLSTLQCADYLDTLIQLWCSSATQASIQEHSCNLILTYYHVRVINFGDTALISYLSSIIFYRGFAARQYKDHGYSVENFLLLAKLSF